MYRDAFIQHSLSSTIYLRRRSDPATMIIGYFLLGVFAISRGSHLPQRGAFAPTPEINSDLPFMVEGDIAVTERSLGSGIAMNAFRTAQD